MQRKKKLAESRKATKLFWLRQNCNCVHVLCVCRCTLWTTQMPSTVSTAPTRPSWRTRWWRGWRSRSPRSAPPWRSTLPSDTEGEQQGGAAEGRLQIQGGFRRKRLGWRKNLRLLWLSHLICAFHTWSVIFAPCCNACCHHKCLHSSVLSVCSYSRWHLACDGGGRQCLLGH